MVSSGGLNLERFDFDSVLLPYSHVWMQNQQYARDFEDLMLVCQERKVAVQTIKTITRRPWGERPQTSATWYEPLEDQADINLAVHWALARAEVFICTAGDLSSARGDKPAWGAPQRCGHAKIARGARNDSVVHVLNQ